MTGNQACSITSSIPPQKRQQLYAVFFDDSSGNRNYLYYNSYTKNLPLFINVLFIESYEKQHILLDNEPCSIKFYNCMLP